MSDIENLGYAFIAGNGRPPERKDMVGAVGFAWFAAPVVIAGGVLAVAAGALGYMVYKANTEPEEPDTSEEDLARALDAAKTGGQAGLVLETMAVAKKRKTFKTPLGVRVPNLARYVLPEESQMRAVAGAAKSYGELKGKV